MAAARQARVGPLAPHPHNRVSVLECVLILRAKVLDRSVEERLSAAGNTPDYQ
jgi:hypothetical protein